MILEKLILDNFGVYRGRHVIELSPPSRKRSIILFGALNGAGKTTVLEALQLVLYGRFARCRGRGDLAYDELLRRSIHRGADPREGASLELEFTHTSAGKPHNFRLRRAWSVREGKTVKEHLEVLHDNTFDALRTEGWAEQIEELLPVRLSQLFFFDGEKIEALADLDRSAEVLSMAVRSLLGLDLVEQLSTDLLVLERKKRAEQKSEPEREAIAAAKQEADRLDARRTELLKERVAAQNKVDLADKRVRDAVSRFQRGGGEALERSQEIEAEREKTRALLRAVHDGLREEATSAGPLLLVADLLEMIAADNEAERTCGQARAVGDLLDERDARLLAAAEGAGAAPAVVRAIAAFLEADRRRFADESGAPPYLDMTRQARALLEGLGAGARADHLARIARQIKQAEALQSRWDEIEQKLASVPDKDAVQALAMERTLAEADHAEAARALRALDAEIDRVTREHEQKLSAWGRRAEEDVDERFKQQAIARTLTYSELVRQAMKRFRGAVAERHVRRIAGLVIEGFRHLLRKESLVSDLRIDPESFSMTLLGQDRRELSPERLSAGERQLLAISMIWGLARAGGRAFPVVIDAPLGRLDSIHRRHLVERYFPSASHQVLLLSTDKEIDEAQYEALKPWVGRAYTLRFDDRKGSTDVERGYFWP